ncbi:uncharacterized protein LOC113233266 [Hyposmocoma kahamanoa]|uniref:uncharacterized protein LOC113233266 n=1 Tax=Hyposmocoma kahamanoa TaxID=1477025 RepID=UPI000E6D5BB2|nr:uncharacterized protein LOC113233266 [Hyposmocoma kahamanoa]
MDERPSSTKVKKRTSRAETRENMLPDDISSSESIHSRKRRDQKSLPALSAGISATQMIKNMAEQLGKDAKKLQAETKNMIAQAKNSFNSLSHITKFRKSPQNQNSPNDDR